MSLEAGEIAYLLGRNGATKQRLASFSGARLEIDPHGGMKLTNDRDFTRIHIHTAIPHLFHIDNSHCLTIPPPVRSSDKSCRTRFLLTRITSQRTEAGSRSSARSRSESLRACASTSRCSSATTERWPPSRAPPAHRRPRRLGGRRPV